jgi:hypothetical protein
MEIEVYFQMNLCLRLQVLTATSMNLRVFWDVLNWMSADVSEVRAASIIRAIMIYLLV